MNTREEPVGPVGSVSMAELSAALTPVLDKGLPIQSVDVAGVLVHLRSVYARAVIPSDPESRLAALNALLPRLIATIADEDFREATQLLFGLAPGTRGALVSKRQREAALARNYSASHFREEKQREHVEAVARLLRDDLLHYVSRVKRATESLEPTGDTPSLGPEHLTHEEELVSRIWQHVYGLRAELIAALRLAQEDGFEARAEDHRQAAMRQRDELRELVTEYTETYGSALVKHGESEFRVEALERLATWNV